MRRICSLLLAVAFCVGVVGCGEPAKPVEPPKGGTTPAVKPAPKAGEGEKKADAKPAATDEKKPAATDEKK